MYDDDLLRRARLCLGLVPEYRPELARLFRYTFEGANWCCVTSGTGIALVRVECAGFPLEGEIRASPRKRSLALTDWSRVSQVTRAALLTWLDRIPAPPPGSREEGDTIVDPAVVRGLVFDRQLVRDWIAPFVTLHIDRIVVSDAAQRMLRVDGEGWIVIVMGRIDEPSDLTNPAVCS